MIFIIIDRDHIYFSKQNPYKRHKNVGNYVKRWTFRHNFRCACVRQGVTRKSSFTISTPVDVRELDKRRC